jgi:hypothetical protein
MNVEHPLESLESDIWNVVRHAIRSGKVVRLMETASRIAARRPGVMSENAIVELLADTALAAGVPVDVEGVPLNPSGSHGRAKGHARTGATLHWR